MAIKVKAGSVTQVVPNSREVMEKIMKGGPYQHEISFHLQGIVSSSYAHKYLDFPSLLIDAKIYCTSFRSAAISFQEGLSDNFYDAWTALWTEKDINKRLFVNRVIGTFRQPLAPPSPSPECENKKGAAGLIVGFDTTKRQFLGWPAFRYTRYPASPPTRESYTYEPMVESLGSYYSQYNDTPGMRMEELLPLSSVYSSGGGMVKTEASFTDVVTKIT